TYTRALMWVPPVSVLTAGQGLHHVDLVPRGDGVGEPDPVVDLLAVDEDDHVFAQGALLVEDVPPRPLVAGEGRVEHLAYRAPLHLRRGTGHVSLDVLGENDACHATAPSRGGTPAEVVPRRG